MNLYLALYLMASTFTLGFYAAYIFMPSGRGVTSIEALAVLMMCALWPWALSSFIHSRLKK